MSDDVGIDPTVWDAALSVHAQWCGCDDESCVKDLADRFQLEAEAWSEEE